MKKRDTVIDITKAIGILLMIIGHWNGLPYLIRNFIFSFHMPLFFILSGYFYKPKSFKNVFVSGNKNLLKPYLLTSLFCIILCLTTGNFNLAKLKFIGIIMSNGGWPNEIFGANLPYIGPIWFFLALYWCKIFYNYLREKTKHYFLYSFLISTIALIIGKYVVNLPFGILTGFCGLVFYSMGDYWRNKIILPLKKSYFIFGCIIWMICICVAHLELASFDCSLYPVSMFAAFIGTYSMYLISKKIQHIKYISKVLYWIGKNTSLILCYHTLYLFIFLNIKHYLLEPNDIVLNKWQINILCFLISLILPYLHVNIVRKIKKY